LTEQHLQSQLSPGMHLAYEIHGQGPKPLLFLHGFGADRTTWHDLLSLLPYDMYRCYIVDLKGCGDSSKPRDDRYGIAAQARLILEWLAILKLSGVTLIGHSFGAAIALMVTLSLLDAEDRTTISRLVILDGACYPQQLPRFMRLLRYPFAEQLLALVPRQLIADYSLRGTFHNQQLVTPIHRQRYAHFLAPPGTYYSLTTTVRQLLITDYSAAIDRYCTLNLPSLVIWGEKDRIVRPELGRRLAATLPNARLIIIPDCGHNPHEELPDVTAAHLAGFLASQ